MKKTFYFRLILGELLVCSRNNFLVSVHSTPKREPVLIENKKLSTSGIFAVSQNRFREKRFYYKKPIKYKIEYENCCAFRCLHAVLSMNRDKNFCTLPSCNVGRSLVLHFWRLKTVFLVTIFSRTFFAQMVSSRSTRKWPLIDLSLTFEPPQFLVMFQPKT